MNHSSSLIIGNNTNLHLSPMRLQQRSWQQSMPSLRVLRRNSGVACGTKRRGEMTGWFEVRTKHRKRLYRLFCLQDRKAPGLPRPALVLITGGDKPNESAFSKSFYKRVRALGEEYLGSNPRSVA